MSPYSCPICGNPNSSNQQSCSQCEFPIAHLDSAFVGVKQQDVLKWAKDKYWKIQKLSLQPTSINDNLDQSADKPQSPDYIRLQDKIKQLGKEKAEIESRFRILDDKLTELGKELPQHIFVDEATKQKLNDLGSNLAAKIEKWNNEQQSKCQYIFHSLRSELARSKCELKIQPPQDSEKSNSPVTTPTKLQNHEEIQPPRLEQLKPIFSELFSPIEKHFIDNIKSLKTEVLAEIKNYLDSRVQENLSKSNISPEETIINPETEVIQAAEIQPPEVTDNQASPEFQFPWVLAYNDNPESFSEFALEVSETEESINQRRLGNNQVVIIERLRKGKGNYWLLTVKNENYLVPKPKGGLKINEFNLPTIEALFQCIGYSPENSQKFTLVKPAIVAPIEAEKWQLQERGVLQF